MRIVLVHGFNVKDGGQHTIDRLVPYLEAAGHTVDKDEADYGVFSLFMVKFKKHKAVMRIAGALDNADAVIAHSNGPNFVLKALKYVYRVAGVQLIFISPAVKRKAKFAAVVSRGTIFFTRTDFWVWISAFTIFLGWGRMGQKGYKGSDKRIKNEEYTDVVRGHSDWFDDDTVEFIAKQCLRVLEAPFDVVEFHLKDEPPMNVHPIKGEI